MKTTGTLISFSSIKFKPGEPIAWFISHDLMTGYYYDQFKDQPWKRASVEAYYNHYGKRIPKNVTFIWAYISHIEREVNTLFSLIKELEWEIQNITKEDIE